MTTLNTERLVRVGRWAIEQEKLRQAGLPSEWDQARWLRKTDGGCGTACCIAGRIAVEDGGVPVFDMPLYRGPNDIRPNAQAAVAVLPDGRRIQVDEYAEEVLGSRHAFEDQGDEYYDEETETFYTNDLFSGDNDIHDVLRIIDQMTGIDLRPELEA